MIGQRLIEFMKNASADQSPARGSDVQATRVREGEAWHNVLLEGNTGEWCGLNSGRREGRRNLGLAEQLPRRLGSPASCDPAPRKQNRTPPPFVARRGTCLRLFRGERKRGGADW